MTERDTKHTDTTWTRRAARVHVPTVKELYLHHSKEICSNNIYKSDILFQSRLKQINFCQAFELDK